MRWMVLTAALAAVPTTAGVTTQEFARGFDRPVFLTGSGNNVFVVSQAGTVTRINRSTRARDTFLTVADIEVGGEKGLLGFAFDPSYSRNGRVYVNVTARRDGQLFNEIRRYTIPSATVPAAPPETLLRIPKSFDNHNGGWIGFGSDKNLLIATGDGGSGNDPENNAQNRNSLLGKVLRIDVRRDGFPGDPDRNYAIPAGNPFGNEVFAYGLRNPYRASVDRATGDLWIGDVGQGAYEEINVVRQGTLGQNFGWRPVEGPIRTPGINDPVPADAVAPIHFYPHADGRSVTGGNVYRGTAIAELQGRYVFGDFITGRLWSIANGGGDLRDHTAALGGAINIASFGEDANRALYVLGYDGRVLRLVDAPGAALGGAIASASAVPEPGTWALLVLGFGLVGSAVRRGPRPARPHA